MPDSNSNLFVKKQIPECNAFISQNDQRNEMIPMKKIKQIVILTSICAFLLSGCGTNETDNLQFPSSADQNSRTEQSSSTESNLLATENEAALTKKAAANETFDNEEEGNPTGSKANSQYIFTLTDVPAYTGDPAVILNDNIPTFSETDLTTDPFEQYSDLDSFGRCGEAYANICRELMPTEKRGEIGMIRPSGWHTVKYNGVVDGNYLYNRCHLIAFSLAGENANEKNLITGTRYMNTVGMIPYEQEVADYVKDTDHHVLYRVTPVFEGQNLVAAGVHMEAMSVEDKGSAICFNVFVYNVQPGIYIDYSNGDSRLENDDIKEQTAEKRQEDPEQKSAETENAITASSNTESKNGETTTEWGQQSSDVNAYNDLDNIPECDYVININSGKFHLPTCRSVRQMKTSNSEFYKGEREDLIRAGYSPCGICNP